MVRVGVGVRLRVRVRVKDRVRDRIKALTRSTAELEYEIRPHLGRAIRGRPTCVGLGPRARG